MGEVLGGGGRDGYRRVGTLRQLERVTGSDGAPSGFVCTESVVLQRYPVRRGFVHLGGVDGHPDFGCAVEFAVWTRSTFAGTLPPFTQQTARGLFLEHEGGQCGGCGAVV